MARWFLDRFAQQGIPSVSLRSLLPGALFIGCPDLVVSGCSSDSRRIEPGEVFVALKANRADGHDELEITRALERGAAGVVVERLCLSAGPLQVVVHDTHSAYSRICQALAGDPSRRVPLIAVAGRTGADITSAYLRAILSAAGRRVGFVDPATWSNGKTTVPVAPGPWKPDVWASMLESMADQKCNSGVLVVSPETLVQRSIDGVMFDIAVLTNLFPEAPENDDALVRERRKHAKLFRMLSPEGTAILNADDTTCDLLGAVNLDGTCSTFGLNNRADVSARIDRADANGSAIRIQGLGKELKTNLQLAGKQNVSYALAAAAAAHAQGIKGSEIITGLESLTTVSGRYEAITKGLEFEVRLDTAETPVELKIALETLRAHSSGRVICILSETGVHSRDFRRSLAGMAERHADLVALTNSRTNPNDDGRVLQELLSGCQRPGRVDVQPNRREAIERTLASVQPGDGVLIAGKGLDPIEIDGVVGLNDRAIVTHWLRRRNLAERRTSA